MRFYTNVQMVGDQILVRGYENGQRYSNREIFHPTLFVPSKKDSKYKTLNGESVEPVKPGTIRETRDFIKKYDGVDGFKMYGFERFIYQYISEQYPEEEVSFDISKINLVTIDIEVKASMDSLMLKMLLRKFFSSPFKTTIPKRLLLGVRVHLTILSQT